MSTIIKVKRSSVQGKVPITTDLELGEFAINTYDGKLFTKKNVNGTESIVDLSLGTTNLGYSANSTAVTVTSDTGSDINILAANSTIAGVLTAGTQTIGGAKTFTGDILFNNSSGAGGTQEGGEIQLASPTANTTLSGAIAIDIFQNRLRIFETSGTNRGVYIDLTTAASTVGTNLLSGSVTNISTSANGSTVTVLSDTGSDGVILAANSTAAGVITAEAQTIGGAKTFSGNITANQVSSTNNGAGTNFQVGDDAWIGDINLANTIRITGQQDATQGYLVFGNSSNTALGRTGTGSLTYGGSAIILASDTASAATASKVVIRDSSSNFAANTITAALTGNASTATTLQSARTIAISGDVTGTATSFNGSADITISAAITADSIVNADINSSAAIADTKLATISSAGKVLNSATTATNLATASAIVARDASSNFSANTITAALSGNATTATTLQTARNINEASFNGSANITIPRVRALDDRIIVPIDFSTAYATFAFGSWNNNNTSPYSDNIVFRTYTDGTGGNDNLLSLRKDALGLRVWQHGFGANTAFATFKDVAWTDGTNASGSWSINASTATTLQTARTIAISGDVTGTATSFNGSADITISAGITANTIVNADISSAAAIADTKLATISTAGKVSNSATTANNAATASAIVARDASGNFAANTITAALIGNATTATTLQTSRTIGGVSFDGSANINLPGVNATGNQNTTGSAATLTTARTIALSGDLSGSATFDGSANVTITATIQSNSVALGTDTTGDYVAGLTGGTGVTISGTVGEGWSPTVAIGQAVSTTSDVEFRNMVLSGNLTVNGTSTTVSATELAIEDNLIFLNANSTITNPDIGIVGNYNDGTYAHTGVFRDATDGRWKFFKGYVPEPGQTIDTANATFQYADVQANTVYAALSGNASTATTLQTARTIGGVSFDGSANINLPGVNTTGDQNTTGSAATLTTARTIGGVSFNGSANIDLPGVNTAGNQNTTGSAATLTTARTIAISGDVTGTATSFNGSANITISAVITADSIVNADINSSAAIADTKLATISTAGKVSNSATTATNLNTANAIVARDASGNFSAGTITAALTGAASSNVLKAGDTMTGKLNLAGSDSFRLFESLNTSASSAIQFYVEHNLGATNVGNARGVLNLVSTGALTIGGSVALTASNFNTYASPLAGSASLITLGTVTTGTWNAGVIAGQYGGTGVNNTGRTITLGGNVTTANTFTTSGNFALALTTTAATSVTFPTSGTLVSSADTGTVTSTMIANDTIVNADISPTAAIAITKLAASTISGVSLGNNLNTLTIGTGLSGTSYNGSAGVTIAIDSTVATLTGSQTLTNKTLTAPIISGNTAFDTDTLFVDSVNNRVGFGTTAPAYDIHIVDAVAPIIQLEETSVGNTFIGQDANAFFIRRGTIGSASAFEISSAGNASFVANVAITNTVTSGTWNGSVISSTFGGTGVNNGGRTLTLTTGNLTVGTLAAGSTITLGGNITTANSVTTSGNFALTLTQTAATNVTLPTTGTLATTGNLSQFAATTSAQLAGVISDETGSGALVFGTSPSFTTSIVAASATMGLFDTTATTVNAFGATTTLNLGYDGTAASTTNISTGATATATTKTVNLGTDGAAGSTTNINIGSSVAGTTTISSPNITIAGLADTATTATHYYVETASGNILPKTLANTRTELVTTAAVNAAGATTLGTVTVGTWNATAITDTYLATISTAGKVSNAATTATNLATASAIVARDASGNFSANTITTSAADTATAASHYFVETASDGAIRPKTLANVQTEIVTSAVLGSGTANTSTYLRGDRSWATVTSGITISDDTTTNATRYLTFTSATSGSISAENVSSTKLTFNPSTGAFTAAGDITSTSDIRVKTNIRTIEDALVLVQNMRGVYFNKNGIAGVGVIAQEMEEVLPEVVLDGEYKSVAYGNIVGVLIEAIKDQNETINTMKSDIEELKALVKKLMER
jgi:hypothetical protein